MARLRWTKEDIRFTDHSRDFTAEAGVHEVPDDVEEEYLSHRSDGWERVDEESDEIESGSESGGSPAGESQNETEFDYTRGELEDKDWSELRSLAVESDHEDINGRSSKEDIIEALAND